MICLFSNITTGRLTQGLLPAEKAEAHRLTGPFMVTAKSLCRRVNSNKFYHKYFFANIKSDKSVSIHFPICQNHLPIWIFYSIKVGVQFPQFTFFKSDTTLTSPTKFAHTLSSTLSLILFLKNPSRFTAARIKIRDTWVKTWIQWYQLGRGDVPDSLFY